MVAPVFLNTPPLDVFGQMALDELLAEAKEEASFARFFNWAGGPQATFGYAQFESSVRKQLEARGISVYTRRPTGGGVVLHKDDLTFTLVFNQLGDMRPMAIYNALHDLIKQEFAANNIALSSYNDKSDYRPSVDGVSSNCFQNPVSDDLLDGSGNKILGGAIRRFGQRVLYQGSLQLAAARQNSLYREVIKKAFVKFLGGLGGLSGKEFREENLNPAFLAQALAKAESQYKTKEWIEKF
ncbi:MAG: hypothetical protein LBM71_05400 [Elusimicrobiota bacterium]|jgi:lipoate-protein ligase A|nr:hypothetical protein [Elusimicrobiota bacterium]